MPIKIGAVAMCGSYPFISVSLVGSLGEGAAEIVCLNCSFKHII